MDNRRLGAEGFDMARAIPLSERSLEVMRFLNRIVHATEGAAWVIIGLALAMVLYFLADREPPFAVVSVEPASAIAGKEITIKASVVRQPHRHCGAEYSRFIFDSSGARYDIGTAITSSEMISDMESRTPGRLSVRFTIPSGAEPGPAHLKTVLDYKCNRTHTVWPITVTTDMPFTVLPSP